VPLLVWAIIAICIFAPLSWVRTIETFKIGYVFAVCVILFMIIVVSTLNFMTINEHGREAGSNWTAFNENGFITMWGISFFMFQSAAVLPVMEASEYKNDFSILLGSALGTLLVVHIYFSELCYYTFGEDLKEPVII
jgi:amino acid permease